MTIGKYCWIKVSKDEYELIEDMADSAEELALKCGVSIQTVYASEKRAKKSGKYGKYRKVCINEQED